ncbi:MAG: ATP-binding protein, partial [Clostridia bacterium]|nr:ATP-binding protein [Clostridia bacterium]
RIAVFADGEIIADGKPDEIFNRSDILEKANLKKPAVMTIWEALEKTGAVDKDQCCPKTPNEVAKAIIAHK